MTTLELALRQEIAITRETLIFEALGKLGDRLPKDVQQDMRKWANEEKLENERLKTKIWDKVR